MLSPVGGGDIHHYSTGHRPFVICGEATFLFNTTSLSYRSISVQHIYWSPSNYSPTCIVYQHLPNTERVQKSARPIPRSRNKTKNVKSPLRIHFTHPRTIPSGDILSEYSVLAKHSLFTMHRSISQWLQSRSIRQPSALYNCQLERRPPQGGDNPACCPDYTPPQLQIVPDTLLTEPTGALIRRGRLFLPFRPSCCSTLPVLRCEEKINGGVIEALLHTQVLSIVHSHFCILHGEGRTFTEMGKWWGDDIASHCQFEMINSC